MRTTPDSRCGACPLDDCRPDSNRCPVYGERNAARKDKYRGDDLRTYNREYQRNRRSQQRASKEAP